MKTPLRGFLVCLGIFLLALPSQPRTTSAGIIIVAPPNKKRHYKHAPGWTAPADGPAGEVTPLAAEEPPPIDPAAAPSLSLQPFLNTHLDKMLAPLGTAAFAQSDLVAFMRDSYAEALPTATDAHKPAYQLAVAMCNAMINSMSERQKAVVALNGAYERRKSEAIQPRGGKRAVKDSDKDEAFFYESQKNNWLQNTAALRQQMAALYQRERAAEAQAGGPWTPPPPSADASPAPSVSVPSPEVDPVVGGWMWEGRSAIKLEADGSIGGSRSGTWTYACTTDAGRNYEMHWTHKGWVDYVVLSADGKILDGKSNKGKRVSANR